VGSVEDGCIRWGGDRRRERGSFGGEFRALLGSLLHSCARATRSSQITLGGFVFNRKHVHGGRSAAL